MNKRNINVLLIEDQVNDARLIKEFLSIEPHINFLVDWAVSIEKGLELLSFKPFDVILINISINGSKGLNALNRVYSLVPELPILIMTGVNNEPVGIKAVQKGAQDYLVKESISRNLLVKAITYSIERSQLQRELMIMAHMDELTGLYNRRGFLALAQQQLKIASRTNRGTLLFFIDIDGMKLINDNFGHKSGDKALIETSKILRQSFRESDIIARIGGDEFVVMAIEINDAFFDTIIKRINEKVELFNKRTSNHFIISLSIGVTHINIQSTASIEELIAAADSAMYIQKKEKKSK
jgi:two-component system, cell cycle response regulator